MASSPTFLGVIPVRGGSKGLQGKNMKLLGGKPLYRWVADTARKSGMFHQIIICTDWAELQEDAFLAGFDTICRPSFLATDTSPVCDTMVWLCSQPSVPKHDYIQLLQATSPFLTPDHIAGASKMILDLDADMVVGITPRKDPTAFVKPVPADFSLRDWYPAKFRNKNRQEFPPAWSLNGYIYLAKWGVWAQKKDWWTTNIYGYPMSPKDDVDIDTQEDFDYAEWRLNHKK